MVDSHWVKPFYEGTSRKRGPGPVEEVMFDNFAFLKATFRMLVMKSLKLDNTEQDTRGEQNEDQGQDAHESQCNGDDFFKEDRILWHTRLAVHGNTLGNVFCAHKTSNFKSDNVCIIFLYSRLVNVDFGRN